ncbi:hypothetical protein C5F63_14040 [Photobacterium damselae subsp. damselae]|uniref:hypothetical protein n=1 Tax=Photobacterium damselae TaxID=38293 RepID=UPI000D067A0A|nr:hypothetical protein [Photobacterium damselae]PSB85637.1 hypothetical protein C5F63_14040 [Photobacterium damselae subsp. damselae]
MSNLYLSRHGIWYFRKVTTLPSGKTKDIKKSLRTRCKTEAKRKAIALLTCSVSLRTAPKDEPTILDFNQELSLYLKSKASHVAERELLTIERFVSRYLAFTVTPQSKRQASKFIDSLDISVATKNKHVAKIGAFFTWLNTRYDEEINNPFDGLRVKETQPVRGCIDTKVTDLELIRIVQEVIEPIALADYWISYYLSVLNREPLLQITPENYQKQTLNWVLDSNS